MPQLKALQFGEHLKEGRLKPVYGFVGDDEALVSECVSRIRQAAERPDLPGSITRDLDGIPEPRDVFDELRTQPFMGMEGVRLVIVREGDEFLSAHGDSLRQYLNAPSSAGVLVLCCGKLDGRTGVAKAIERTGLIVDCSRMRWQDARHWLDGEARKTGKTLTPRAVSALVEAVGPNLSALRLELEKLVLYVGDEPTIAERDVEEVTCTSRPRSIFELSDAIARSDAAEALRLGEGLLLRGERPEGIVGFLGRRTRTLWQVKRMLEGGAGPKEIARELGMKDYAAEKSVQAARRLGEERSARLIELLAQADVELKTTSLQSRDSGVWLSSFLSRLCQ